MDLLGTDITKVAGAYAAFAGLLAGFVFAVIGYLLANSRQPNRSAQHISVNVILSWSVLAFVSLSVASFLFALLSGEDRFTHPSGGADLGSTRIRPLVLHMIASGVFTLAILVVLLALIWLFNVENPSNALLSLLRTTVHLTGLMTLFYFDGTFLSISVVQGQRATDNLHSAMPTGVVFLAVAAIGEGLGYVLRKANLKVQHIVRTATQSIFLVTVYAGAGLFNFVAYANEAGNSTWHVSSYEWWGVAALGAVLLLCILNLPNWRVGHQQTGKNDAVALGE